VIFLAALSLVRAAFAGQGAASYLDFNGTTAGFGTAGTTSESATTWSTSAAGTAATTARPSGTQLTIGATASDFLDVAPETFSINLDGGGSLQGVVINSTNVNVTFTGSANTHNNSGPNTWMVTNFASLTVNQTRQQFDSAATVKGLNWNSIAVTFTGGGTITFQTPMACNDSNAVVTDSMLPTGAINLANAAISSTCTYKAGFTLNSGTLNFASAGSAYAFSGLTNGQFFTINGGVIDNTSFIPIVLQTGTLNGGGTGGLYSLGGPLTFTGSSSLDLGTSGMTNKGNNTITVNANTLAIGGVISGPGNSITKLGNGTLLLYGANTYSGNTLVEAGTLALTNGGSLASSPVVVSNSTFDVTGLSAATTLPSLSMTNSTLNIDGLQNSTNILTTTLIVGGTANTVNVSKLPFVASFPTTFHLIKASAVNGTLNYTLGTLPPTPAYQAYISNNVANNSVDLVITNGPTANSLKWTGINAVSALPDGTWDIGNTETWQVGGVATNFNQDDIVTFDDSATGLTTVNVTGGEAPSVLTVSNNAKSYTFTGNGIGDSILGGLTLNKFGTGSLLLQENNDSFTGGINVNAGSVILDQLSTGIQGGATVAPGTLLQLGNNDNAGVLPAGTIMVNGALLFNQTNNLTVANAFDGNGVLEQFTSNILVLSGTSTGSWSVVITNGILQAANNTALGSIPGGSVTVTNNGRFDLSANTTQNNANFGNKQFIISGAGVDGNGVIVNNGGTQQQNAFQNVVLVGDATIGGADRWDLRGGTPLLDLAGHTLTKTNANQVTVVSGHITSGNIIIQQGLISFEVAPVFDPSAGTITVNSGAYVGQFRDILNSFTRSIVLNGGGTTNLSGANTNAFLDAPILLTADSTLNTGAGTEYFNNVISDGGSGFGLTEIGIGTNLLAGTNTYSGDTIIAGIGILGGTLGLTNHGSIANSPVIVVTNGSIFNISGLAVPFTGANTLILGDDVQGTGTLIAGNTVITNFNSITLSNASISLAITNPIPTTPNITVINLNLGDGLVGSTITITALPQLLSPGQYPLIKYVNATGTYNMGIGSVPSGFVANLVNNTGNHSIDLQVTAVPTGVWSGGGNPDFNWSNPANWRGTALTSIDPLLFMGTIGLNNTNDTGSETAQGITFASGSGAFVLSGNPVTLSGGGITNNTANIDAINLGLSFSAPQVFTAVNGTLVIGGGLTNAATGNTNLLTLAGRGILTNLLGNPNANTNTLLLNSAGTTCSVMDNASSTAISVPWVLNNNNGTFNFGNATSAPKLTLTTLNGSPQDNQLGSVTNETSVFNMSNGTFTTTARLNTGLATNAVGIINQYGGTMTIGNQFQGANGSGGSSSVNISGGVMNVGSAANPASPFYVASRGPGALTVGSTGVLNCGTLDVSRSINSSIAGTVNLNSGGTIVASLVSTATSSSSSTSTGSTGTFNFNGGTLRAYTNAIMLFSNCPASPLVPLNAVVKGGGAFIDSSTNTIIFAEGLNTDPSLGGAQDGGLTKIGNGTLILNQPNTYNGNTIITAGTLALSGAGSIASTTNIVIAANATFDVSAATFALGSSQVISNSGSTALIGGNVDLSVGKLSLTYAGLPSLSSTNGTLTLAATTGLRINNTGAALPAGTYTIISNTTGGAVAGTVPSSFNVTGGGIAGGTTASLQISGGALNLVVATSATPPPPKIQHITFSGGNIILTGTNNNGPGGTYHMLTSMSLTLPLSNWGVFTNGTFDTSGNFAVTNAISGNGPRLFYIIQVP
jgi:autotransporter-associated beta strand protein